MKVFITGATGFVGGEIVRRLVAAGHQVRALVRLETARGLDRLPGEIEVARGDVLDGDLDRHLSGMDAVVHLVGIIRDYPSRGVTFERVHVDATRNVIAAMESAGVKRLAHMSALGAAVDGRTEYFRTKGAAEALVLRSDLAFTVMKPSVIFGPGDEFVTMLAGQVGRLPVVPVLGDGRYLLQPVAVGDVAAGFVQALTDPRTVGKVYEVGGPERLSYHQLLDHIARALGRERARTVHVPLGLMRPLIQVMERFSFFPITSGQLEMLLMSNVCDPDPYFRGFGIAPVSFADGIRAYLSADPGGGDGGIGPGGHL